MKISTLALLAFAIMVSWATTDDLPTPPLKALLYSYLPAVNTANPFPEYDNLAKLINKKLENESISVRVYAANKTSRGWLYDPDKINSLFADYDILEVDVSYLWAIKQKTKLLTFKKQEIDFYNRVHPFEWEPTTQNIDGQEQIIGSPGLLCSSFLEERRGTRYDHRLYGAFDSQDGAYPLVDLYLNFFVNGKPQRTLDDVDYNNVDGETIKKIAAFLTKCQQNTLRFNYDSNWCLKKQSNSFFETNYSTTTGYSENLFNFLNNGTKKETIWISHVTQGGRKKVFYIDSFVAKSQTTQSRKDTVKDFYKYMLSDDILDIYVKGLYTNSPKTTYLIPPTISYFKKLIKTDRLYGLISDSAFHNKRQFPIYQPEFAQNVFSLAAKIDQALKDFRKNGKRTMRIDNTENYE